MLYDLYYNRVRNLGSTAGESIRNHSQKIMDSTWTKDPACRKVYVKWVDSGLPMIDDTDMAVYAKFNAKSYHNITGDEVAYLLQFRLQDLKSNTNIKVGAYVSIENEIGDREWWLIWHLDDRPQFRQCSILKCTWTYQWTSFSNGENIIHKCLGVTRNQKNYNSGVWLDFTFQVVEQQHVMFLPANWDTNTIQYDTKFLISNVGRYPPIAWKISKIQPSVSFDIVTFTMTQEQFNPIYDNYDLMIANYYKTAIIPNNSDCQDIYDIKIQYSYDPIVNAGGGVKKFEVYEKNNDVWKLTSKNVSWSIDFGENNNDIIIDSHGNYCNISCKDNYSLIGQQFELIANVENYKTSIFVEVTSL